MTFMMEPWIQSLLVLLILTDFVMLGSSRVWKCIRLIAVQGAILAALLVALHARDLNAHVLMLALGTLSVKTILFPWILMRAIRLADVDQAVGPIVGYGQSLIIGVLLLPLAFWLSLRLPLPNPAASPLIVPIALFTMLVGLLLLVSRNKAVTQVLSFLLLENGISLFGVALLVEVPLLVELGTLLDVLGAIFVMGIALFNINQSFDHIDTSKLSELKE